jgi:hypothetical protein
MNYYRFTVAAAAVLSLGAVAVRADHQGCVSLSDEKLSELSLYVEQKYKLPVRLTVFPRDVSFVGDTCFRRLRFSSAPGEVGSLAVVLFLSPDQRFLSRELLDSSSDPALVEQEERRAVVRALKSATAPALGPPDAAVTITVFSDFQCPYCREQAKILRAALAPVPSQVRIVFRNLPLPIHTWSRAAAEAAACAAQQGNSAFWAVHDFLFNRQPFLNTDNLAEELQVYVNSIGTTDGRKFAACVQSHGSSTAIDADIAAARDASVEGHSHHLCEYVSAKWCRLS